MDTYNSLSHSRYDCKYHVVFVPKYRRKKLYGKIKGFIRDTLKELSKQRGSSIKEGAVAEDHVHMLIEIPPKYSVAEVIGYMKGKSEIAVARQFGGKKRNFRGERFWSRGYAVATVGVTYAKVREYIEEQTKKEKQEEGLEL